jgi:hypothetical protein
MKTKLLIAALTYLTIGTALAETPWETYLSLPTAGNASRVSAIKYSPGAIPSGYGYLASDLDILKIQVLAGDREAFRLTYRLILKSDGGPLGELIAILAHSIRPNPEFFLREMATLKPHPQGLKSILLMPGLEYVDRRNAQDYEIEMRRKALASVKNEDLRSIRDQCLKLMKDD